MGRTAGRSRRGGFSGCFLCNVFQGGIVEVGRMSSPTFGPLIQRGVPRRRMLPDSGPRIHTHGTGCQDRFRYSSGSANRVVLKPRSSYQFSQYGPCRIVDTIGLYQNAGGSSLMSSVEKTIKIVKHNEREPFVDHTQGLLKTDKQSRREMAKVVASWIEERKELSKERARPRGFVFSPG